MALHNTFAWVLKKLRWIFFFFEMCKKEPAEYSCLPKSQILFIAVYFQVCSLPVTTRIPEFTRIPENKATTIFSGIRVGICNVFLKKNYADSRDHEENWTESTNF